MGRVIVRCSETRGNPFRVPTHRVAFKPARLASASCATVPLAQTVWPPANCLEAKVDTCRVLTSRIVSRPVRQASARCATVQLARMPPCVPPSPQTHSHEAAGLVCVIPDSVSIKARVTAAPVTARGAVQMGRDRAARTGAILLLAVTAVDRQAIAATVAGRATVTRAAVREMIRAWARMAAEVVQATAATQWDHTVAVAQTLAQAPAQTPAWAGLVALVEDLAAAADLVVAAVVAAADVDSSLNLRRIPPC